MSQWEDDNYAAAGMTRIGPRLVTPDPSLYAWNGRTGGQLADAGDSFANRQIDNPNAAADRGMQNAARAQQSQLAQMLSAQAHGQGPNMAAQQFGMQQGQNISQAMAAANSGRGGNVGSIQNQAATQGALATQQAGVQAGQTRMLQQQQAMNGWNGVLNQQRGQDLQSQGLNNRYVLGMQGLNDAQQRAYLAAELEADKSRQEGGIAYGGQISNNVNAANGIASQEDMAARQRDAAFKAGLIGAGTTAAVALL